MYKSFIFIYIVIILDNTSILLWQKLSLKEMLLKFLILIPRKKTRIILLNKITQRNL